MDKTSGESLVPALNAKRKPTMYRLFSLLVLKGLLFSLMLLSSCATPQLPPAPPKYVYEGERKPERSVNSLWSDTASLYEDFKAKRVNDLVTINVVENISGSGKADTSAARKSALDAAVEDFFGAPINQNTNNFWGQGHSFSPTLKGSMNNNFQGTGETTREGKLLGTITAKVVEVMPNGNLFIESRKEITINNEKQILILRGMIRPVDISPDNTILSSKVADAQVFFIGDGVLQDKQKPGWLVKIMDKVWPF
jgi:flagellar L-ring protein precursor FlgH